MVQVQPYSKLNIQIDVSFYTGQWSPYCYCLPEEETLTGPGVKGQIYIERSKLRNLQSNTSVGQAKK